MIEDAFLGVSKAGTVFDLGRSNVLASIVARILGR